MTNRSNSFLATAALGAALILTAGCDQLGIHGAASMQVEVEVYKGPLSKTMDVQQAELEAKLNDAFNVLETLEEEVSVSMCRLGCFDINWKTRSDFRKGILVKGDGQLDENGKSGVVIEKEKYKSRIDIISPFIEKDEKFKIIDKRKRIFSGDYKYNLRRKEGKGDKPSYKEVCDRWPEGVPSRRPKNENEYKICNILYGLFRDTENLRGEKI